MDYRIIATELVQELNKDLDNARYFFTMETTILTLLLEKGVFTEEEFKTTAERYKSILLEDK